MAEALFDYATHNCGIEALSAILNVFLLWNHGFKTNVT